MKRKLQTMPAIAFALFLASGCANVTPFPGTNGELTFCQGAKPLRWSQMDTDDTIVQIKELNAVGVRLCGWGK